MITYYLALDRGKASLVVPVVGGYPVLVVILAMLFLGETIQPLRLIGIACTLIGLVLVGLGS